MPPRRGNRGGGGRSRQKTTSSSQHSDPKDTNAKVTSKSSGTDTCCGDPKDSNAKVTSKSSGTDTCCGTCGSTVDENSLGCDSCPLCFHDTASCTGLPQSAIQGLKDAAGAGLRFECTSCRGGSSSQPRRKAFKQREKEGEDLRSDPKRQRSQEEEGAEVDIEEVGGGGGGGSNESAGNAVPQLHETIKALCNTIADLEKQISTLTNSQAKRTPVSKPSSLRESPEIEIIGIVEPRKKQRVTDVPGIIQ